MTTGRDRKYEQKSETTLDLANRFTYHAPKGDQYERYQAIRDAQAKFADLLVESCPGSRELSLALTHLEEVGFYANASIARHE
jgi:hypothetical protein